MAKKFFKRTLSAGLALTLCLSLAAPAFAEEGTTPPTVDDVIHTLPGLGDPNPDAVPTESPYTDPYTEAKKGEGLLGEGEGNLGGVNGQIDTAYENANEDIKGVNTGANNAASNANDALEGIDTESYASVADTAAKEANDLADKAKDESLSLEEREDAAKKAAEQADAAKIAAGEAEKQYNAAKQVLADAQEALEKANGDYKAAVDAANALLNGNEDDPGLRAQAQQLIEDARAKVESAEGKLTDAETKFNEVEGIRAGAWSSSEEARIAAEQAALAAFGQQGVINTAKDEHSEAFVNADKNTVDTKANEAINAKELQDAAQGVVDAQTKVDDLSNLKTLTEQETKLNNAKTAYDTADKELNGYTDENGNHVKGAQEIAQSAKDTMPPKGEYAHQQANDWLNLMTLIPGHTNREAVNKFLALKPDQELPNWLTEERLDKVIQDAKEHWVWGVGANTGKKLPVPYVNELGKTLETLKGKRADLATEEGKLNQALGEVKTATGITDGDAQAVLGNLSGQISDINKDGKYNEELKNLSSAISGATEAVGRAKTIYTQKGGTLDLSTIANMRQALSNASAAYSTAIAELNGAAGTKLTTEATVAALNGLKTQKANVEKAKRLISEMERTAGLYETAQQTYSNALAAAKSANDQYQAAKKAVKEAREKLDAAKVNSGAFTDKDFQKLNDALTAAQTKLNEAEAAKNAANEKAEEAGKKAEDAENAYNQAVEDANRFMGGDTDTEIGDTAIPLASGPVTRAQFIDYLWRHEGSPEAAESELFADHEFAPAIAWALSYELIDETFVPDELVTVADVQAILGAFAGVFGTNAVAVANLTTLSGDAGEAVLNCDEVLAEFFGEEYTPAGDKDVEIAA